MVARDASFYDLIGVGLEGSPYQVFVDEVLSDLQNGRKTDGFDWSPDIQMDFTYEQLEMELGIASIPTYVDVDSPGTYKTKEGVVVNRGSIPRAKHGFAINEKRLREEIIIAQRTGRYSYGLAEKMRDVLFESTSDLITGNYNGLTYQRDQMVSKGSFTLTTSNNPSGILGTFEAKIPAANKTTLSGESKWYTAAGVEGTASNPIKDLQDKVKQMKNKRVSSFHFEVDELTFDKTLEHSKVREAIALNLYPTTQNDNLASLAAVLDRTVMKAKLEAIIGAPIKVVNNIVRIEVIGEVRSFAENVWALVPDGSLGDIKAVQPLYGADPAARFATYDGGRTVLKQWFDTKTNTQYIESELTALVVPARASHMFQLIIA